MTFAYPMSSNIKQIKGDDFSIRPLNVLDQLKVIPNVTSDDLHDHSNDFFLFHVSY